MSIDPFKYDYVPTGELIKKIEHGIIYFVHNGRNAWHSTWVQKYYHGCMHSTLKEAKEYCEERRTNGSVFYIIEMPAIIARLNHGKLIATQINTAIPFGSYSPQWVAELENGGDVINQKKSRAPSTIEELIDSLKTDSEHWNKPLGNNQPVLLFWLYDNAADIAPITESPLATYKSISHGKKYHLSWCKLDKSINPTRVIEISTSFKAEFTHEQAAKDIAHSICYRLTKEHGVAFHLLEISKLDTYTFQVEIGVKSASTVGLLYKITTDTTAKVTRVEYIKN